MQLDGCLLLYTSCLSWGLVISDSSNEITGDFSNQHAEELSRGVLTLS